ncbi:alpha/beta-hydrolase [Astrocystis sublimbata]|nr:alpha/beta-hydrolase [Astrocystis sublimbata]
MSHPTTSLGLTGRQPIIASGLILLTAAYVGSNISQRLAGNSKKATHDPSPGKTLLPTLSKDEIEALPYPPDALPGGRDVDTPYGSIRVFEWGPEDGERVLFIPGITTPVVALGDLAHDIVARGYRVILFDLFGRGYSDAPNDSTYDERLYTSQILLVLASSRIPWLSAPGFHLIGYSLGGALSVAFTRYFPHHIQSLTLISPGGLIRRHHIGWTSWLYYTSGLIPDFLVRHLVDRRMRPAARKSKTSASTSSSTSTPATAELGVGSPVNGDGDVNGGVAFDGAAVSTRRPHVTVSEVVTWQLDEHKGFVPAFMSTIRNSPIYAAREHWDMLSNILESRRSNIKERGKGDGGLSAGRILVVLGRDDGTVVLDETIGDIYEVLGRDGVEFAVLDGGHEVAFTSSTRVAELVDVFWKS